MKFNRTQQEKLRRHLLSASAAGDFRYYMAAEQVFLGIETLSIELRTGGPRDGDLDNQLDALFQALYDETGYLPEKFSRAAGRMLEAL
jgi:hypothetical protein